MRYFRGSSYIQALDADLSALGGVTSAANKVPYFTGAGTADVADFTAAGRALVDDATAAAQRATLSLAAVNVLIAKLTGADLNVTTDQALTMQLTPAKYLVRRIVATNASGTPTLAAGGFYTAASKGGAKLVETTQLYTALSAATKFVDTTLLTIATTDIVTSAQLYMALTTANGSAMTCDVYVYGEILEP